MRLNPLPWGLLLLSTLTVATVAVSVGRGEDSEVRGDDDAGSRLFFDKILSADGEVSCATCHDPKKNWTSGGLPPKLGGGRLARRAPSVLDRANGSYFFWDGRASSLEEQAKAVLTNKDEMGNPSVSAVFRRVRNSGRYPTIRTEEDLINALTAYEKLRLKSQKNRHDVYLGGKNDLTSLTAQEVRGWDIFRGDGLCYKCHTGPNFTDEKFHNTGVGISQRDDGSRYTYDMGRWHITNKSEDICAYKTPGLRGVSKAAPYMHDASIKTLEEIVEFYDRGGIPNKHLDKEMKPLGLSKRQKADLVAFLRSL